MPRSARPRWSSSEDDPWSFLSSVAFWFLRLQIKTQARVVPGSAHFSHLSDRAENRNGREQRNHDCEPQARNLDAVFPDRERGYRVSAGKAPPETMDHRVLHRRNVPARTPGPRDAPE